MLATGDILTDAPLRVASAAAGARTNKRYDFDGILAPVAPIVAAADLAICHMEVPVGRPGQLSGNYGNSAYGGILLVAPYELAGDLDEVGFDRCSTASNHSWDIGPEGIASTLDAFDELGITHTGTARTPQEAGHELFTVNGVRVAHLSFTIFSNTGLAPERWRFDYASSPRQIADAVRSTRAAGAEVVIVSLHTSKELLPAPTPNDRAFTTALVGMADIDLVVQHGPHVIQPMELVGDTWVYWSLGNFLSGMGEPADRRYRETSLDGLLAWARFTERTGEPGRFGVDPTTVLLCTEQGSRVVHAGIAERDDPGLSPSVRAQLDACITRSTRLVPKSL